MVDIATITEFLDYDPLTGYFRWKKRPAVNSKVYPGDRAGSENKINKNRTISFRGTTYKEHILAFAIMENRWPAHEIVYLGENNFECLYKNIRECINWKNEPITHNNVLKWFTYLPETGQFIRNVSTNSQAREGTVAGGLLPSGYRIVTVASEKILEHRLAYFYMKGVWPDLIDHINGITWDNRWDNLRNASKSQNAANVSSKDKNIIKDKGKKPYIVSIKSNEQKFVQRYSTIEEAREAAKQKRNELHGEFANHGI